jgi:adenylate cyclase
LPADIVIEVLNRYVSEMSDAILDNGGTLVAYMGDGIMAVFGAPIEMAGHADCALAAAREMLASRLPCFNDWVTDNGLGDGFRMGMGLSSGPIMSGTVGSERRLEYTTVGDTTNTAARLEAMTKNTPYSIFIADSTRRALREPAEDLVFVDELDVRGKRSRVRLWTLAQHGESETHSDVVRTGASR